MGSNTGESPYTWKESGQTAWENGIWDVLNEELRCSRQSEGWNTRNIKLVHYPGYRISSRATENVLGKIVWGNLNLYWEAGSIVVHYKELSNVSEQMHSMAKAMLQKFMLEL